MPKRPQLWRYSTGTIGVNRIQVYERETGATIYVEWRDDLGRHQKALSSVIGHPVTDREVAKKIADRLAQEQEARRNRKALEAVFGPRSDHTLGDLLEQLHADKKDGWSALHLKDQKRFQKFWFDKLGRQLVLREWAPAMIERVVREAGDKEGWSSRTRQAYLRYILDASKYACRKLKWIEPKHDLSGAVDVPAANSQSKAYSQAEIPALLDALREVDLRAAFVGEVAWLSGRRLNAIRTLPTKALELHDDYGLLRFPAAGDKAKKSGEVVLVGEALTVASRLLTCPAVRASGIFCVQGNLDDPTPRKDVTSEKALIQWLHRAEEAAGIEHVEGRAYHGIKRRFATAALDENETAAEKQSGTNADTLRRHYVQDDLGPKIALARALEAQRRAG